MREQMPPVLDKGVVVVLLDQAGEVSVADGLGNAQSFRESDMLPNMPETARHRLQYELDSSLSCIHAVEEGSGDLFNPTMAVQTASEKAMEVIHVFVGCCLKLAATRGEEVPDEMVADMPPGVEGSEFLHVFSQTQMYYEYMDSLQPSEDEICADERSSLVEANRYGLIS